MAITTVRIRVGERWYTVEVGDLSQSPVEVTVEGQTFQVEIEGLQASPYPKPRRGRPRSTDVPTPPPQSRSPQAVPSDNILRSPMPGRVISILVRPGERVSAGAEVCVVEAMKMEQSILAPKDGTVKTIYVQPMDPVGADDPLVELE